MSNRVNIDGMDTRHPALTPPIAGTYREAACVCLNRYHSSPSEIMLSDNGAQSLAELAWTEPDSRILGAWSNTTDATAFGAYSCVIAGIELLRGLFAVRRAETGTGADYYIGLNDSALDDLEGCMRLEVSGLGDGNEKDVNKRLLEKVAQVRRGNGNLPAVAGVIGFSARLLMVRDVLEES
jgi:hypothetical protein